MTEAFIVDAVRSPIGKRNGTLSHIRADELGAQVLNALVERNSVDPAQIEDVREALRWLRRPRREFGGVAPLDMLDTPAAARQVEALLRGAGIDLADQWSSYAPGGRRGAHSAKPEDFAEMIERLYPTLPKIELNRRGPARPADEQGLGRHARSHPSRALCRMSRTRGARGFPDGRDHRQPEREKR